MRIKCLPKVNFKIFEALKIKSAPKNKPYTVLVDITLLSNDALQNYNKHIYINWPVSNEQANKTLDSRL